MKHVRFFTGALLATIIAVPFGLGPASPAIANSPSQSVEWLVERDLSLAAGFTTRAGENQAGIKTLIEVSHTDIASLGAGTLSIDVQLSDAGGPAVVLEPVSSFSFSSTSPALDDITPTRYSSDGSTLVLDGTETTDLHIWFGGTEMYNVQPEKNYSVDVILEHKAESTTTSVNFTELEGRLYVSSLEQTYVADASDDKIQARLTSCVAPEDFTAGDNLSAEISEDNSTVSSPSESYWASLSNTDSHRQDVAQLVVPALMDNNRMLMHASTVSFTGQQAGDTLNPLLAIKKSSQEVQTSCMGITGFELSTTDGEVSVESLGLDLHQSLTSDPYFQVRIFDSTTMQLAGTIYGVYRLMDQNFELYEMFTPFEDGTFVAELIIDSYYFGETVWTKTELTSPFSVNQAAGSTASIETTGTGTGQGGISATEYSWTNYGSSGSAGADGQGGLLTVGNPDTSAGTIELRRISKDGPDTEFAGETNGVTTLTLPSDSKSQGYRTAQISTYGTAQDNFFVVFNRNQSGFSSNNGLTEVGVNEGVFYSYGTYASGESGTGVLVPSQLSEACESINPDPGNLSLGSNQYYEVRVQSSSTSETVLTFGCQFIDQDTFSYSNVDALATLDPTSGEISGAVSVSNSPTLSCRRINSSNYDGIATGSETAYATVVIEWNNNDGCYGGTATAGSGAQVTLTHLTADGQLTTVQNAMDLTGVENVKNLYPRVIIAGGRLFVILTITEFTEDGPSQEIFISSGDETGLDSFATSVQVQVNGITQFSNLDLSSIRNFKESVTDSVLLQRRDFVYGGSSETEFISAARIDLSTGEMTTYQQVSRELNAFGPSNSEYMILTGATSGELNLWAQTAANTVSKINWVTTGEFDDSLSESPLNQDPSAEPTAPSTPSSPSSPSSDGTGNNFTAPRPFEGPLVSSVESELTKPGAKVTIKGEKLDRVTEVFVGSESADFELGENGLSVTVPDTLAAGTYQVKVMSKGLALVAIEELEVRLTGFVDIFEPRPSTKKVSDSEAKVYFFAAAGAGKIQFMLNGEEIAWVRTDDPQSVKLHEDGYLVRTVTLEPNTKNVIEILVDGERVRRTVYSR